MAGTGATGLNNLRSDSSRTSIKRSFVGLQSPQNVVDLIFNDHAPFQVEGAHAETLPVRLSFQSAIELLRKLVQNRTAISKGLCQILDGLSTMSEH